MKLTEYESESTPFKQQGPNRHFRATGPEGDCYRVKHCAPVKGVMDDEVAERMLSDFVDAAQIQQRLSTGAEAHWAPVFAQEPANGGQAFVSRYYHESAADLLKRRCEPEEIRRLLYGAVCGQLEIQRAHDRAHGNLKPSNILIGEQQPSGRYNDSVVLTDPASTEEYRDLGKREATDVQALGQLCFRLVFPNESPPRKLRSDQRSHENWQQFGDLADQWASLCERMLEVRDSAQPITFEEIESQLKSLEVRRKSGGALMFFGGVLAVAAVVLLVLFRPAGKVDESVPFDDVAVMQHAYENWLGRWNMDVEKDRGDELPLAIRDAFSQLDIIYLKKLRKLKPGEELPDWLGSREGAEQFRATQAAVRSIEEAVRAFAKVTLSRVETIQQGCRDRGWEVAVAEIDRLLPRKGAVPIYEEVQLLEQNVVAEFTHVEPAWSAVAKRLLPVRETGDPIALRFCTFLPEQLKEYPLDKLAQELERLQADQSVLDVVAEFIEVHWKDVDGGRLRAQVEVKGELSIDDNLFRDWVAWARECVRIPASDAILREREHATMEVEKIKERMARVAALPGCDMAGLNAEFASVTAAHAGLIDLPLVEGSRPQLKVAIADIEGSARRLKTAIRETISLCSEDAEEWIANCQEVGEDWDTELRDWWQEWLGRILTSEVRRKVRSGDGEAFLRCKDQVEPMRSALTSVDRSLPKSWDGSGNAPWIKELERIEAEARNDLIVDRVPWRELERAPGAGALDAAEWKAAVEDYTSHHQEMAVLIKDFAALEQALSAGFGYREPHPTLNSLQAFDEKWLSRNQLATKYRAAADVLDDQCQRVAALRRLEAGVDRRELWENVSSKKADVSVILDSAKHLVLAQDFPLAKDGPEATTQLANALKSAVGQLRVEARRKELGVRVAILLKIAANRQELTEFDAAISSLQGKLASLAQQEECESTVQAIERRYEQLDTQQARFFKEVKALRREFYGTESGSPQGNITQTDWTELDAWRKQLEACGNPCQQLESILTMEMADVDLTFAEIWADWLQSLNLGCDPDQTGDDSCRNAAEVIETAREALILASRGTEWRDLDADYKALRNQQVRKALDSLVVGSASRPCDKVPGLVKPSQAFREKLLHLRSVQAADAQVLAVKNGWSVASDVDALHAQFEKVEPALLLVQRRTYDVMSAKFEQLNVIKQATVSELLTSNWRAMDVLTAFLAWRRLQGESVKSIDQLEVESSTISPRLQSLIRELAEVAPARSKELEALLPDLAARWHQAAGLIQGVDDVHQLLNLQQVCGVERLPAWMSFNRKLFTLRRLGAQDALSAADALLAYQADLAGHEDFGFIQELVTKRDAARGQASSDAGGGDLENAGPAAAGWRVEESSADKVARFSRNGVIIAFRLVEPEDAKPAYVGTSEVSVAMLQQAIGVSPGILAFFADSDERRGPRSWVRQGRVVEPPGAWLEAAPLNHPDSGVPTVQMPVQYIPPRAAAAVADALGCRLPTVREWQRAAAGESNAQPNLRDASWEKQRAFVATKPQIPPPPYPDADAFCGDYCLDVDIDGDAQAATSADDGTIWFRPVQAGHDAFQHLRGNVAEFVLLGDATAPLAEEDSRLRLIGDSALGDALVWAGGWNQPVVIDWTSVTQEWCADAGFRLAFTAPRRDPLAELAMSIRKLPCLTATGTLSR